jgi:hypothetical protein
MISKTRPTDTPSAAMLRRMSFEERESILVEAAALAEAEYIASSELTDFEAFAEEDLHGQSTATPEG